MLGLFKSLSKERNHKTKVNKNTLRTMSLWENFIFNFLIVSQEKIVSWFVVIVLSHFQRW